MGALEGTLTTARSAWWTRSSDTLHSTEDLAAPRPRVPATTASALTRFAADGQLAPRHPDACTTPRGLRSPGPSGDHPHSVGASHLRVTVRFPALRGATRSRTTRVNYRLE